MVTLSPFWTVPRLFPKRGHSPLRSLLLFLLVFFSSLVFFTRHFGQGSFDLLPPILRGSTAHLSHPTLPSFRKLVADHKLNLHKSLRWSHLVQEHNNRQMDWWWRCVQLDECRSEKTGMVVMLNAEEFRLQYSEWTGGETIWAKSIFSTLNSLGYTTLISASNAQTVAQYEVFGPWTRAIIMSSGNAFACFSDPTCSKQSPDDQKRIPVWKIFSFHFWAWANSPLGPQWTVSPEPAPEKFEWKQSGPNFDLGYAREECLRLPLVSLEQRLNQAFMFAKKSSFFFNKQYAWSDPILSSASDQLNVTFLAAPTFVPGFPSLPPLITHLNPSEGLLPEARFFAEVARSIALVGVGDPPLSPSPYDALCQGVPFINPILNFDAREPDNREKWLSQHSILKHLDPPYVYNVHKGDEQGFVDALRAARKTPFPGNGRYVPLRMREVEMEKRVRRLVEGTRWREEAAKVLKERKEEGEGELFVI